tara:strand:+ start:331 stop:675 length:345 start_codon:yes stop_codon:yes gene_type:complete
MSGNWVPEIYYEEADDTGLTSHIPFISPPENEDMPKLLFIFESRETGEFEPGQDGEDLPVVQIDLHQYADMAFLKEGLDAPTYDKVRAALGLQPLAEAAAAGSKITERIRSAVT